MVAVIIEGVLPARYDNYAGAVRHLHQSHSKPAAIGAATERLRTQLDDLAASLRQNPPSPGDIKALRRRIAENSAHGRYADYSSAEQAFLALESLSYALGDRDKMTG